jgi:hypothetical protein
VAAPKGDYQLGSERYFVHHLALIAYVGPHPVETPIAGDLIAAILVSDSESVVSAQKTPTTRWFAEQGFGCDEDNKAYVFSGRSLV